MSDLKEITIDLERGTKGIGILLDKSGKPPNQHVWVDDIMMGTPAAESGKIKAGDTLLKVNGESIEGRDFSQIMDDFKKDAISLVFVRRLDGTKLTGTDMGKLLGGFESKPKIKRRLSLASIKTEKKAQDQSKAGKEGKEVKRRGSIMALLTGGGKMQKIKCVLTRDHTGLGIVLDHKGKPPQQQIWVDELVDGTPASKCGKIKRGDLLKEVAGENIEWMPIEEVVKMLGTQSVKLVFMRNKKEEDRDELTKSSDAKQLFDARKFSEENAKKKEREEELAAAGRVPTVDTNVSDAEKEELRKAQMSAFAHGKTAAGRRQSQIKKRSSMTNGDESDEDAPLKELSIEHESELQEFEEEIRKGADVSRHRHRHPPPIDTDTRHHP
jgi:hypothetical protein